VKLLIANHWDFNTRGNYGCTAFILTAQNGHSECVKLPIENHCDVNVSNGNGDTAQI
jgi:ankyrin repeat protein